MDDLGDNNRLIDPDMIDTIYFTHKQTPPPIGEERGANSDRYKNYRYYSFGFKRLPELL